MAEIIELPGKLEETESSTFAVLKPETYLVEVDDYEAIKAKTGTPQVRVQFSCIGSKDSTDIGVSFSDFFTLTDKAMWKIKQLLDAAFGRQVSGSQITPELIGKKLVVKTILEKNLEGKDRMQIARFLPEGKWNVETPAAAPVTGNEEVTL